MTQENCQGHQLVVVAGGYGTRLAEETSARPKPMVEIGGKPLLWHIMKCYAHHGVSDFIVCLGYKGHMIKEWFANQFLYTSDVTVDTATGGISYHKGQRDAWKVHLVDTGPDTMTGGRIKRVAGFIHQDRPFLFTYGDGVSDIDFSAQLAFHREHGKLATVTSVFPPSRYGNLVTEGQAVIRFKEKPKGAGERINGGFFIFEPGVLDYIAGDEMPLEDAPLTNLAADGELMAWRHDGYWQAMDTLRERHALEEAWQAGAPWKLWS